jgi:hypothetical protein
MSSTPPQKGQPFIESAVETLRRFLNACRRSIFFREASHAALVLQNEPASVRALFLQFLRNEEEGVTDPVNWALRSARESDEQDRSSGRPLAAPSPEMDLVVDIVAGISTGTQVGSGGTGRDDVFAALHRFFASVSRSSSVSDPVAAAAVLAGEDIPVRALFNDILETFLDGSGDPFQEALAAARDLDALDRENGSPRAPVSPVIEALVGFLASPPACPRGCPSCGGVRPLPGTVQLCADPWIASRFQVLADIRLLSLRWRISQEGVLELFTGKAVFAKGHLRRYLALYRGECTSSLMHARKGAYRDGLARTLRDGRPPISDPVIDDVFTWLTLFPFWGDPLGWLLCGSCGCPFRP